MRRNADGLVSVVRRILASEDGPASPSRGDGSEQQRRSGRAACRPVPKVRAVSDLDVDGVAARLSDTGLSAEMIAYATDLPLHRVKSIVVKKVGDSQLDEKITKEVGRLAQLALKQAFLMLEFGPTDQKLAIVKTVLSSLTRQATAGEASGTEEMRIAFESFVEDMKHVPELETVVTETDFLDVEVVPAVEDADDQDERS